MDLVREIDVPVGCYWSEEDSFEFTFWSLSSFAVQLYILNNAIQRAAPSSPPKNAILFVVSPAKTCVYHKNILHRVYTNLNSSFLDPSFLEWRLGCKTCIVYTGLYTQGPFFTKTEKMLSLQVIRLHVNYLLYSTLLLKHGHHIAH